MDMRLVGLTPCAALLYADQPILVNADQPKDHDNENEKWRDSAIIVLFGEPDAATQSDLATSTSVARSAVECPAVAGGTISPASSTQPPPASEHVSPDLPSYATLVSYSERTRPANDEDPLVDCCVSPCASYALSPERTSPPSYSQSTSQDRTHPPAYTHLPSQRRLSIPSTNGTQMQLLGPRAPSVSSSLLSGTHQADVATHACECVAWPRRQATDGGICLAGGPIQARDQQPCYRPDSGSDTSCHVCADSDSLSSRSTLPPPYQ